MSSDFLMEDDGWPVSRIFCHACLTLGQYEPIVAKSTPGIGSLGLHRIQMFEGSPLKVRDHAPWVCL
jgi:hypothetical protein